MKLGKNYLGCYTWKQSNILRYFSILLKSVENAMSWSDKIESYKKIF